jgi:hypothetical protein
LQHAGTYDEAAHLLRETFEVLRCLKPDIGRKTPSNEASAIFGLMFPQKSGILFRAFTPSRPLRRCNLSPGKCRECSFRMVPTFEPAPAPSRNFGEHTFFRDADGVLWADALTQQHRPQNPVKKPRPRHNNENRPSAVLPAFTYPSRTLRRCNLPPRCFLESRTSDDKALE